MSPITNSVFSNSVRPEPVEGHGCMGHLDRFRAGFDRLSPNGIFVSMV